MSHRIITTTICMVLSLVYFAGVVSPVMAVDCECPCCGLYDGGAHQSKVESGHLSSIPAANPHGAGCNHCTYNPQENREAANSVPALLSQHAETQVRMASAGIALLLTPIEAYDYDLVSPLLPGSAPIYLQTLSIRI